MLGCAARRVALGRVIRAALAISLHRSEHATPPETLAALVPSFLPSVPIDPWNGTPLRYDAGPMNRVWSVGRNGRDEGGTRRPGSEGESDAADDDGIVFGAVR